MQDYFSNYKKGESYVYGLKCKSPEFVEDIREVITLSPHESKTISIVHDIHSRKFLQVRLLDDAKVSIDVRLIASSDVTLDSFIEVIHEGSASESVVRVHGYAESGGKIISRVRTHVPAEVHHAKAVQNISLYQFGQGSTIDCIPLLEVKNKTTQSSHSVRLERISEDEYWQASRLGIEKDEYSRLKKKNL